jgi:3-oxoacyl-[acyl-carrier protein] reductase
MSTMPSSFAPSDRLDGRVAVIAGGLGAVGRATAKRFAALGARVVLLHRKGGDEARELLRTLGSGEHFDVNASITDSATLAQAAESVKSRSPAATSPTSRPRPASMCWASRSPARWRRKCAC